MPRKILIMGRPRSGKTTLAKALAPLLRAVHFDCGKGAGNARDTTDLSSSDPVEEAQALGQLCDQVIKAGHYAIADLVCSSRDARLAFGQAYTIYLNTSEPVPFPEHQVLFVPPFDIDYEVREQNAGFHAQKIAEQLIFGRAGFDWNKPTALVFGQRQSFDHHDRALVLEALARVGQVCIAMCGTDDIDAVTSYGLMTLRERIEIMLAGHLDKIAILSLPAISTIFRREGRGPALVFSDLSTTLKTLFPDDPRPFAKKPDAEKESTAA